MIVGLIFFGIITGVAAAAGTLLFGASIWIGLLIYTAIGTVSVLGLAVRVAFQAHPDDLAARAESYALAGTQRS